VEILLWLVPSAVVAVLAMLWVAWAGRPQREQTERSEAAYERFVRAITREHPTAARPRPAVPRDRSTGIAVRPSRAAQAAGGRAASDGRTRRSA
jgi:uncharacterized membrane protein YccC